MIFRSVFIWKSFLISFFLLIVFSNILINAEPQAASRDLEHLPGSKEGAADLTDNAESHLARVEAEDPDLVGSVLDIDIKEANKVQTGIKPSTPILEVEDSKTLFLSVAMIIVSEIGDKTFFIAALMAMKNSRFLVFSAAFGSLIIMSILSAALGYAVPNLIPREYTNYLASVLFLFFGLRMAQEGYHMSGEKAQHEIEEISSELKEKDEAKQIDSAETGGVVEEDVKNSTYKDGLVNLCQFLFSPVFVQTFVLTFLAEWGDRSQIATIALSASQNVYFVTLGVILGHGFCTGLAVIGGRFLAAKISVKTVTIVGSILFISFSILYLYEAIIGV